MARLRVAAFAFGLALTFATTPAFADGLVLNDVKVNATDEGGGYAAEISVLNTGTGKVDLADSIKFDDSSCTAVVTNPTVLPLQATKVKLTFDRDCFGDGNDVKVDIDGGGPLVAVTVAKPSSDRTWWPFLTGLGVAAVLAAVAFFAGRRKIGKVNSQRQTYNKPTDDEDSRREKAYKQLVERVDARVHELNGATLVWKPAFAPKSAHGEPEPPLGAIEVKPYGWSSPVAGLEAGWSFKDSWAANLTVATTAFVALLNSGDTLTAVLGDKHETALGVMTVAGLLSAVIIAVANTLAKLIGPDPATVTAGGLTLSTALVTAAAALQIVVVGGTVLTLVTGIVLKALVFGAALIVLGVLIWYARQTLYAALAKAENIDEVDPVLAVPADAFDAWKVSEDWQQNIVLDRIRATFAKYLNEPGQSPVAQTVVQGYTITGPQVAATVIQSRVRASLI